MNRITEDTYSWRQEIPNAYECTPEEILKLKIPSLVPRNPFWKTKRSTIPHQDKRHKQNIKENNMNKQYAYGPWKTIKDFVQTDRNIQLKLGINKQ